eukprot:TRINITY_DN1240_c0_g1_i2.p2 TRINITY_DN1240_c0_g1~~TRINITY_DN1240_c0_g1_i2.p2  ORF type:complete len:306 (-),score=94.85 TRINITY_DN1240_c0_g1_i2:320-1150(-)
MCIRDSSNTFVVAEVLDKRFIIHDSFSFAGSSTVNYPVFYHLRKVFANPNISLSKLGNLYQQLQVLEKLPVMLNPVDYVFPERFLSLPGVNLANYHNYLAASMLSLGIPIVYYGSEMALKTNGEPVNIEPLWENNAKDDGLTARLIANINDVRSQRQLHNTEMVIQSFFNDYFAFSRGDVYVILTNLKDSVSVKVSNSLYAQGTVVCNIASDYDDDCFKVQGGLIEVVLEQGRPIVLVPRHQISCSKFDMNNQSKVFLVLSLDNRFQEEEFFKLWI